MKFPMDHPKDGVTIGDLLDPAMDIRDQPTADRFLKELIERAVIYHGQEPEEAERIQKSNLACYAGHGDPETSARICRLFLGSTNDKYHAFAEKMWEISRIVGDPEGRHGEADELLCSTLAKAGYKEGVEIFEKIDNWCR